MEETDSGPCGTFSDKFSQPSLPHRAPTAAAPTLLRESAAPREIRHAAGGPSAGAASGLAPGCAALWPTGRVLVGLGGAHLGPGGAADPGDAAAGQAEPAVLPVSSRIRHLTTSLLS